MPVKLQPTQVQDIASRIGLSQAGIDALQQKAQSTGVTFEEVRSIAQSEGKAAQFDQNEPSFVSLTLARLAEVRRALPTSGLSPELRTRLDGALAEVIAMPRPRVTSSLADAYEDASLSLGAALPRLRPVNVSRSLVHVAVGAAAIVVLRLGDERTILWTATCALVSVWLLEGARRVSRRWRARGGCGSCSSRRCTDRRWPRPRARTDGRSAPRLRVRRRR